MESSNNEINQTKIASQWGDIGRDTIFLLYE